MSGILRVIREEYRLGEKELKEAKLKVESGRIKEMRKVSEMFRASAEAIPCPPNYRAFRHWRKHKGERGPTLRSKF